MRFDSANTALHTDALDPTSYGCARLYTHPRGYSLVYS